MTLQETSFNPLYRGGGIRIPRETYLGMDEEWSFNPLYRGGGIRILGNKAVVQQTTEFQSSLSRWGDSNLDPNSEALPEATQVSILSIEVGGFEYPGRLARLDRLGCDVSILSIEVGGFEYGRDGTTSIVGLRFQSSLSRWGDSN